MVKTTLKNVKPGEYFTLKPVEEPTEKLVYIREGYDRSTKKYGYSKFTDCNSYNERKGDTVVYIDFTF